MRPLGILKYYGNNIKKFIPIFSAIILSVFLLYTIQMLIDSSFKTTYRAYVQPQKYFSSICAKGKVIEPGLVGKIKALDTIEKVLPWVFTYTNISVSIGEKTGSKVINVKQKDMAYLMSRMKLRVKEGRLPEPGTDEIILHENVAANKGLKIGSKIGSNINNDEMLQGTRSVVGILEGESIVSFASLEDWMRQNDVDNEFLLGMLIIPKAGAERQLNSYLYGLDATNLDVRTFASVEYSNRKETENIQTLLTLINIMVIIIVSICIGFLCYIYFSHRRSEFGILSAIGYTRQYIINRAFKEIVSMCLAGFIAGVLISLLTGLLLNLFIFTPKGQTLELISLNYFLRTTSIPLFIILFSIVPVWRMLKGLDPVSIIEGVG